ncbi:MAG: MFS transporter [Thermovirgaceae bacterium]|nr:MFS transporter [Thermovirgaceae bacterium]
MQYFRTRFFDAGLKDEKGFHHTLRALGSRNYRLFFMGQSVSLIGLWIQRIALSWLVYRITLSPLSLGFVDFIGQIPVFCLTLFTGVWLDRSDLRNVLIVTQWLAVAQALLLAALTLSGFVSYWHIVFLSAFLGVVNSFDMPARQAYVIQLVERKEDLGNAIALNSSLFNGARLIGPSIAGIAIAAVGEGFCFLFNGISFLGTIAALRSIKTPLKETPTASRKGVSGVLEGIEYAFGSRVIRELLMLLALLSLIGLPYLVLLPVFAREVLGGGPQTLGYLMASSGVGALGGTFFLASRKGTGALPGIIARATALFGLSLSAFAVSATPWLSFLLISVAGFGMVLAISACNTLLQTLVDDHMRARVMSLYVMSLIGIGPLGSLMAGAAAHFAGVPVTFFIGGLICAAGGWRFERKALIRKDLKA